MYIVAYVAKLVFWFSWDITVPGFAGGEIYALVAELENYMSWVTDNKRRCVYKIFTISS